MPTFKIGDRVRCISRNSRTAKFLKLRINDEFIVMKVSAFTATADLLGLRRPNDDYPISIVEIIPSGDFELVNGQTQDYAED